jgi:hypothetical protein
LATPECVCIRPGNLAFLYFWSREKARGRLVAKTGCTKSLCAGRTCRMEGRNSFACRRRFRSTARRATRVSQSVSWQWFCGPSAQMAVHPRDGYLQDLATWRWRWRWCTGGGGVEGKDGLYSVSQNPPWKWVSCAIKLHTSPVTGPSPHRRPPKRWRYRLPDRSPKRYRINNMASNMTSLEVAMSLELNQSVL